MRPVTRPHHGPRRGLTTIAVMICLLIITLISGALLKVSLARRIQARDRERRLQTEWLVESGLDRALARLGADPDYKGETWTITTSDLGFPLPSQPAADAKKPADITAATISITIETIGGQPNRRQIKVRADYKPDKTHHERQSRQIAIDLIPNR
jgi:Tfp pilus assembly protein PilV